MGVAAVLITPTLITAANPELAYAKVTSNISSKAKSVIAKISAINPNKSDYIAKTKSAVSAFKKLSSKDKKTVSNYATLKKHWSSIQTSLKKINYLNKKVAILNSKNYALKVTTLKKQYDSLNRIAKAAVPKTTVQKLNYYANKKENLVGVIAKIKAINPKKSDYVAKTQSALSAYNKLSKTDKKKVTNYSTLKTHLHNIQPYLKKADAFGKQVATLNTQNFTTKSVDLEKQYNSLDAITKAAVPSTTLKKLSYYTNVIHTNKLLLMSVSPVSPDGTTIFNTITSYKKLSGAQQSLLKDLINNTSAQANLDKYLAIENIVKDAADIEKQYAALNSTSKTYARDLVNLYNNYTTVKDESMNYGGTTYSVSGFVPQDSKINEIGITAYATQIKNANDFAAAVNGLTNASTTSDNVQTVVTNYKNIQSPVSSSVSGYPSLAPIDLVDKNTITTYNKFAPIPNMVTNFNNLPTFPTASGSLTTAAVSNVADLLTQYNKLGTDQKTIVQNALNSNAKIYLPEAKNIASAQAIDKSYQAALNNSSKPSYFVDLLKVNGTYKGATPEVQRFVVNATKISDIPNLQEYKTAQTAVDNFTTAVNAIPTATDVTTANNAKTAIDGVISQYNTIASKPSWLALVDKNVLKTYNDYAQVPSVLNLVSKIQSPPYTANQINNITSAIKGYKKLGTLQTQIVDLKYPTFADIVLDEANIASAQKIDSAYLKLKKSSNTYPKDAKAVYSAYDDASTDVQKYVVNSGKISGLLTAIKGSQDIADTFETKVNALNNKSTITNVESAVDFYNTYISTSPKLSDLVDKAVMKKYNDYAPVSNVVKLLSLIKESNVSSPSVTPTDVRYIQQSTIAYNALKPDPKMIIDDADRTKFPFLYDGKYITEAAAIDKAFDKVKPTDSNYELEVLDVYYKMYDRAPAVVQKYVANKAELDKIGTRYAPQLTIVREFETKVRQMTHISESGFTPTIKTVRNLEQYYDDNVKYNKINAKYNIPLTTLIDPQALKDYYKYALVLKIQDIAKNIYVSYGRLYNNQNVEFGRVKDNYYCMDAPTKDPSRCHSSDYYEIAKRGYTDSGKRDGNPIKITNPNDIQLIYKAIDYFQQLDTPQISILEKAPQSLTDTYYKDRYGGNNDPNTEEGDVHPSIPMSDAEIKNFLKAQEIDKEYEALKPSSKSYIQDAIALYYKFYKAGKPVQLYTIHENDINAFSSKYDTSGMITGINNFEDKVNKLSNKSTLTDIVDDTNHLGVVDQYNKLNEAQLAVIDQGVLTKYNAYAPIADIMSLTPTIPVSGKTYKDSDIDNMLKAISIYKKLAKDPKAIIDVKNTSYQYLSQEADIKAAQKVDKAFKALDKTDDKYVTKLKQVKKDFDALSDTAKKYVTSNIQGAIDAAVYQSPSQLAQKFEKLIVGDKNNENDPASWLNMEKVPYNNIANAVNEYNKLSSKAKSLVDDAVMKIYNKYAPIVEVVVTLNNITPPTTTNWTTWTTSPDGAIGYYKSQGNVGTSILNAIALYNKLGSDQKDIVSTTVSDILPLPTDKLLTKDQFALLNETNNIKAAQALDKKIDAIQPKSTNYVKSVIDANTTLEVMPKEQRVYLLNATTLNNYETKSQTQKAITDLKTFEQGVQQVDQWTSEIKKDVNGNIGTCSNTPDPCNTAITKKMTDLKDQFNQLNTPRIVDGAEVTLSSLIDRTILARYQYFRAIYDVKDQL